MTTPETELLPCPICGSQPYPIMPYQLACSGPSDPGAKKHTYLVAIAGSNDNNASLSWNILVDEINEMKAGPELLAILSRILDRAPQHEYYPEWDALIEEAQKLVARLTSPASARD